MDAFKVVQYGTSVSPANVNLNDTTHFLGTHTIQISNSGSESITYLISHEAGITISTKAQGDAWVSLDPPYSTDEGDVATVSFSKTEITVPPGETQGFSVTFTEPSIIDAAMLPVYGGAIIIAGSNREVVRVTYMGKMSQGSPLRPR